MMPCPCKECENKGCGPHHDNCKSYQEWLIAREQEKAHLKKMNERGCKAPKPRQYW